MRVTGALLASAMTLSCGGAEAPRGSPELVEILATAADDDAPAGLEPGAKREPRVARHPAGGCGEEERHRSAAVVVARLLDEVLVVPATLASSWGISPEALASRALAALPRLVQLALWASRSFPRLREAAPLMRAVVEALVRDDRTRSLLTQVYRYVWQAAPPEVAVEDIRSIRFRIAGPEGQEDVVNAGEQLIAEGERRGRLEGLRVGIIAALSARAVALSELGHARVASCTDVDTLTRWLQHAVTATSEADVFAGESAP